MTGLARVAQDRHYLSDVVGGVILAAVSILVPMLVFGRDCFAVLRRDHLSAGWEEARGRLSKRRAVPNQPSE